MTAARKLIAGDLFCGGGGFSKGFARSCEKLGLKNVRLIAVNHSQVAVDTHKSNHPWAEHYCSRVDQLDPRKLVPQGRMKILIAAPECTNHANARGARPINDQSRATAWDVVKWAQELYIETILIENVREIQTWGPLGSDGRPLKSKKGEIFRAWIESIKRCGYNLEYRILNAADFGGATTRQRFFLIAKRVPRKIVWPNPTHAKDADKEKDLFNKLKPWRGAHEIIDWSKRGKSIFDRKKPLAPNTIKRIEVGIRKFWGPVAEPFLVLLRGTEERQIQGSARATSEPLPTITAGGIHAGIVQPFIITPGGADLGRGRSVSEPLPTVLCHERFAVVEPFVLQQQSGGVPRSTKNPLPTIAGTGAQSLVQPFIVPFFGERNGQNPRTHSVKDPLPTITSHGAGALVEPFIVQANHGPKGKENNSGRVRGVSQPLTTITTTRGQALVQPFLVKYNGTGKANSIQKPLPTVTSVERLGLVEPTLNEEPKGYVLDILFRMLEPEELAQAMGFERHEFKGTKRQKVLMIGNAVEVNMAEALCTAALKS